MLATADGGAASSGGAVDCSAGAVGAFGVCWASTARPSGVNHGLAVGKSGCWAIAGGGLSAAGGALFGARVSVGFAKGPATGGTAAALTFAVLGGASILRVHDVSVMAQAVRVARALARKSTERT